MSAPFDICGLTGFGVELGRLLSTSKFNLLSLLPLGATMYYGIEGSTKAAECLEKEVTLDKVREAARLIPEQACKILKWNVPIFVLSYCIQTLKEEPTSELPSPIVGLFGVILATTMGGTLAAIRSSRILSLAKG